MYIPYSELSMGKDIGGGTFADVFAGTWDKAGGRLNIAIKALKERDIPQEYTESQARDRMEKRFNRELQVWQRLRHPNILEFYGYSVMTGAKRSYVFISPLRSKGNLLNHLSLHRDWSAKMRLQLALPVARGLEYLHTCPNPGPIFHGDIKPNNIVLQDDFTPQLCDFGLARVESTPTGLTTSGPAVGSENFAPLETWIECILSVKGDIFAFAGVLLTLMSEQVPFYNVQPNAIVTEKLLPEIMPDPADHPKIPRLDPLWVLMRQCWAKTPTNRPTIGFCIQKLNERLTQYSD